MEEALKALSRLVADGVIEGYAIGGAIAAAFYIQALSDRGFGCVRVSAGIDRWIDTFDYCL